MPAGRREQGPAVVRDDAPPAPVLIELPCPPGMQLPHVNVVLVEDDPLTLIDAGPGDEDSWAVLGEALAARGHVVSDIGLVLLTHHHPDHTGHARRIHDRSGATYGPLVPRFEDPEGQRDADTAYRTALSALHGAPTEALETLHRRAARRPPPATIPIARRLDDGDELALAHRTLIAHHRPGHSPADLLFHDPATRTAVAGDVVYDAPIGNVVHGRPLTGPPDPRARARQLVQHVDSLARTRAMALDLLLTGHGPSVTDHHALVDRWLDAYARRTAKALDALRGLRRPGTAWEVSQAMWAGRPAAFPYMVVTATLASLDLLEHEGRVTAVDDGEVIRYSASC
jgi:glyoxylase-like metal-dependent hydrolase (beta-lactamase superfamily II)